MQVPNDGEPAPVRQLSFHDTKSLVRTSRHVNRWSPAWSRSVSPTIYDLSLGEPGLGTPKHTRGPSVEAIKAGYTHYPAVGGMVELNKAVAEA